MRTLKNTLITFIIILLNVMTLKADNVKYIAAVKKGIQLIEAGKTAEDYVNAANYFQRVSTVEKTQWIPLYYEAYSNFMAGILNTSGDQKDSYFEKALSITEAAITIKQDESELYALKAYIQFMKMYIDPMTRMSQGMKDAMTNIGKAKAMNPANPRPYFIDAQNSFYTPANFGGGKTVAKPKLENADKLFTAFKPADELMPVWGAEKCSELLKQCQ